MCRTVTVGTLAVLDEVLGVGTMVEEDDVHVGAGHVIDGRIELNTLVFCVSWRRNHHVFVSFCAGSCQYSVEVHEAISVSVGLREAVRVGRVYSEVHAFSKLGCYKPKKIHYIYS